MNVICIKLSSGEELIARVAQQSTTLYGSSIQTPQPYVPGQTWPLPEQDLVVESAMILGVHQVAQNQAGITFSPWAIGNQDGAICINRQHVTAIYQPVKELEEGFISQTTGIAMPSNSSVFKSPATRM